MAWKYRGIRRFVQCTGSLFANNKHRLCTVYIRLFRWTAWSTHTHTHLRRIHRAVAPLTSVCIFVSVVASKSAIPSKWCHICILFLFHMIIDDLYVPFASFLNSANRTLVAVFIAYRYNMLPRPLLVDGLFLLCFLLRHFSTRLLLSLSLSRVAVKRLQNMQIAIWIECETNAERTYIFLHRQKLHNRSENAEPVRVVSESFMCVGADSISRSVLLFLLLHHQLRPIIIFTICCCCCVSMLMLWRTTFTTGNSTLYCSSAEWVNCAYTFLSPLLA